MRHPLRVVCAAIFFAAALPIPSLEAASPIIREEGAIYLSDFGQKPMQLKMLRAAPCYFDVQMTRFGGTMRFPQVVKAEAFSSTGVRIRGNAQQGGVAAWVPYGDLEGVPPGFFANLQKAEDRRQVVAGLIARNEVAIGMTVDEVRASLGKPQKTSKRADKTGLTETWEFIKYDLVPQTVYGQGVTQSVIPNPNPNKPPVVVTQPGVVGNTIYVKVPVGTMKVEFKDGIVESLDQTKGTLVGNGATIVVPPINVFW